MRVLPQTLINLSLLGIFGGIFTLSRAFAEEPPTPREVPIDITNVFVPAGFDETDPYAVFSGNFPNDCYSWKRVNVKHVSSTVHEITAVANVRPGFCLMVLVPYTEEAALGKLDEGRHKLRFMSRDGNYIEKDIVVE